MINKIINVTKLYCLIKVIYMYYIEEKEEAIGQIPVEQRKLYY